MITQNRGYNAACPQEQGMKKTPAIFGLEQEDFPVFAPATIFAKLRRLDNLSVNPDIAKRNDKCILAFVYEGMHHGVDVSGPPVFYVERVRSSVRYIRAVFCAAVEVLCR
ncbi:hypothetical protein WG66_012489, partial [Moniliophthora roreri]